MAIDPIPFPESNLCLSPPPGATGITDLDVHLNRETAVWTSKYKLTTDEIERIEQTGEIWLQIIATGHPPVRLSTTNPLRGTSQ